MENMTTVYEIPWLIEYVHQRCEATRVTNTDKLEDRVIGKLADFIDRYPEQRNNRNVLRKWTDKYVKNLSTMKFKNEQSEFFSELSATNEEGEEEQYEPADVLANVERSVIDTFETKRTIDLLAQADRRKELVLTAWAEGIADATYISDTLARALGGNATSHRVFIQRFKTNCKRALLSAAI